MDERRTLVLSLHPRFADSILTGSKTVELRRQRVATPAGTPVILYASSPVMAVVGTALVADVHIAEPDEVWRQFHRDLGLSREEFVRYTQGVVHASALRLTAVDSLALPVPLAHLRASQPFNPPQSYYYLNADTLQRLVHGHPMAGKLLELPTGKQASYRERPGTKSNRSYGRDSAAYRSIDASWGPWSSPHVTWASRGRYARSCHLPTGASLLDSTVEFRLESATWRTGCCKVIPSGGG
jgi:predicted transcriptional regulator